MDSVRLYLLAHGKPLCVGVALYLKYSRFYSGFAHDFVEHFIVRIEVADAQRTHLTHCHGFLHIFPCTHEIADRLVDIQKVDIIGLQACQHLVDGFQCLALTVFRRPQFRCNPYLLARDSALFHGFSDTAFIVIGMGGINMPIAGFQCRQTRLLAYRVGRLHECSQSELRHQYTVVELYHRYIGRRLINILCGNRNAGHQGRAHKHCNKLLHILIRFNDLLAQN